ncbi:MAG TPA: hypothetical protein VLB73_00050 [Patescibacteria group bacterium]|nr:hypothetical protein [Patescibacteria group bacterium]
MSYSECPAPQAGDNRTLDVTAGGQRATLGPRPPHASPDPSAPCAIEQMQRGGPTPPQCAACRRSVRPRN